MKTIRIQGKSINIDPSKKTIIILQPDIMAIRAIKTGFVLRKYFNVIGICKQLPSSYYKGWGEKYFTIIADANLIKLFGEVFVATKVDAIYFHNPGEISVVPIFQQMKIRNTVPIIYDINDSVSWNIKYAPSKAHENKNIAEQLIKSEEQMIDMCSRIVAPSIQLSEYLKDKYKTKEILTFTNYFCDFDEIKTSDKKHSDQDGLIHLACFGSISGSSPNSVYYYIDVFKKVLENKNIKIHILPSTYDNLPKYQALSHNVVCYERKDPVSAFSDLSMCDLGLNIFNPKIWGTDLCKYSYPNKTFDCLSAGLPILTHISTPNIYNIVKDMDVGFLYDNLDLNKNDFTKLNISDVRYKKQNITNDVLSKLNMNTYSNDLYSFVDGAIKK